MQATEMHAAGKPRADAEFNGTPRMGSIFALSAP